MNVGRARTIGLVTGALFLSSPRLALYTRFALLAKCRVCLSWLIKRLLCRLVFYRKQSLGAPGQSCDCFVIAKTMVSVLHANLISCRVGFALSCFTKNLKLFCCSVSWREPFCLTEYLRGRSKIRVFILATEPITYKECVFRSSSARSVFYWNAFRENLIIFFSGRVRGLF